jgi:RNA polymerase sigma factor (sigma-70 family)
MTDSAVGASDGAPLRRLVSQYLRDARKAAGDRVGHEPDLQRVDGGIGHERVRKLVEPHLFYVVQVANELKTRDVEFEDLLAVGNVGLVEAAHHYDPGRKVKFLTYAAWWIRKRILEYLVKEGQSVRLTRYARERRKDVRFAQEELRQQLGREPSAEEVAQRTGLPEATVQERMAHGPVVVSLDPQQRDEDSPSLSEVLEDDQASSPEDVVVNRMLARTVSEEVRRLPGRQRRIIENRFGLDGGEPLTFQELGRQLGLSRERARQIEREALSRLRSRLHRRMETRR